MKDRAPTPVTVWMEVDLHDKELPTGKMADTSVALSRMCGVHHTCVSSAILSAKKRGSKCKYVRVEIDDGYGGVTNMPEENEKLTHGFLRESPCVNCPKVAKCNQECLEWREWFGYVWRDLRWVYLDRKSNEE